jgi:hypothetical protein
MGTFKFEGYAVMRTGDKLMLTRYPELFKQSCEYYDNTGLSDFVIDIRTSKVIKNREFPTKED